MRLDLIEVHCRPYILCHFCPKMCNNFGSNYVRIWLIATMLIEYHTLLATREMLTTFIKRTPKYFGKLIQLPCVVVARALH